MQIPLTVPEVGLWLAVMAIITLITSELLITSPQSKNFIIDKKRLRYTAIALGIAFMFTVILRVFQTT
jgi:hypothetical protein